MRVSNRKVSRNMNTELLLSASKETPWAKAMRLGLFKHGPTPIYDSLVLHYSQPEESS
jgi:hypothetical protein